MAITTIAVLKERIKTASKDSQIIVFRPVNKPYNKGKLESYFYHTIKSRRDEVIMKSRLVGIFDNTQDEKMVDLKLKLATKQVE